MFSTTIFDPQIQNFTVLKNISRISIIIVVLFFIGIVIRNSIENTEYQPFQKKHPLLFGLNTKFMRFNICLVLFMIVLFSIPLFYETVGANRSFAAQKFLEYADTLLSAQYKAARLAVQEKNFTVAQIVVESLQNKESVDSVFIVGPSLKSDTENFYDIDYLYTWMRSQRSDVPYEPLSEAPGVKKQEAVQNLNISLKNLNYETGKKVYSQVANLQFAKATHTGNKTSEAQTLKEANDILDQSAHTLLFSYPKFSVERLRGEQNKKYFFYRPIFFLDKNDFENFVHGALVLELSTDKIMSYLERQKQQFLDLLLITAALTILGALLSAHFTTRIVTRPIRKITEVANTIITVDDRARLQDISFDINRNDEIGVLAHRLNEAIQLLKNHAIESKELMIGQSVQKMFIPLQLDSNGEKQTIAHTIFPTVEFFGYYTGVKNVSGDYFDYFPIGSERYIIIKCDVSGKGVPAALIMIEIASLFVSYFKNWDMEKNGDAIDRIVAKINDFLFENALLGRFACFTVCLLDAKTKTLSVCNAGDHILPIYKNKLQTFQKINLHPSIAAGVQLSSQMNPAHAFVVERIHLDAGDIVFLFTDGLEDSRRTVKAADLTPYYKYSSAPNEREFESFGKERIFDILNAVIQKGTYTLIKQCSEETEPSFQFDFSTYNGELSDLVLSVVAIENIFRMHKTSTEEPQKKLPIDPHIDAILKKYFLSYQHLPVLPSDSECFPTHVFYNFVEQERQFDDIAFLAFRV